MPRVGALLLLSREHHHSLVMARDARRAADNGDAAVQAATIARMESHWHAVMAAHFEQEERLIQMAEDTLDPDICSAHSVRTLRTAKACRRSLRACAGGAPAQVRRPCQRSRAL